MDKIDNEKKYHDNAFENKVRVPTDKYYTVSGSSRRFYSQSISRDCKGKSVLEYGCGPGSSAIQLTKLGADVVGIDISEYAIKTACERAKSSDSPAKFMVMNAEGLHFPDNSFDIICGSGIIHHLDLDLAFSELRRTLKPSGRCVFLEPLGHNPLINLYRRLTPTFRTVDEHPLLQTDLLAARKYFEVVDLTYFHLSSIASFAFRDTCFFDFVCRNLEALDRAVFQALPFMRKHAWSVVICMTKK